MINKPLSAQKPAQSLRWWTIWRNTMLLLPFLALTKCRGPLQPRKTDIRHHKFCSWLIYLFVGLEICY